MEIPLTRRGRTRCFSNCSAFSLQEAYRCFPYISIPVGRERVEFNTQRIWDPRRPIEVVRELQLVEFSGAEDDREFLQNTDPQQLVNAKFGCGFYRFTGRRSNGIRNLSGRKSDAHFLRCSTFQ